MMSFLTTSYSILIILDSILTRQFCCLFYYTSKFLGFSNMLGIEFSLHCLLFLYFFCFGFSKYYTRNWSFFSQSSSHSFAGMCMHMMIVCQGRHTGIRWLRTRASFWSIWRSTLRHPLPRLSCRRMAFPMSELVYWVAEAAWTLGSSPTPVPTTSGAWVGIPRLWMSPTHGSRPWSLHFLSCKPFSERPELDCWK